jgi:hypothetical protein
MKKSSAGIKFVAALLMIGGLLGVAIGIWLGIAAIQQAPATIIIAALIIGVFVFCVYQGFGLWGGKNSSHIWTKRIFAAQIPIVSFPGFSYEFYTGLSLSLMGGENVEPITMDLGSSFSIYFSPEIQVTHYGINIIAIIVFTYLLLRKTNDI